MREEVNDAARKQRFQELVQERIEQLRKENGETYYTLSYKSILPMTTMMHIVNGTTKNPGAYTIMKICDGLGITLKEFFDTKEFEEVVKECD